MSSPAIAECDPATNAAAVAEARQALGTLEKFATALRAAGLPVPPKLLSSIDRFGSAISAGIDLGEAAGEAAYQVRQIVEDKTRLCAQLSEDEEFVCKAEVARKWQLRSIDTVLNWSNTDSVIRRAVDKWLGSRCDRAPSSTTTANPECDSKQAEMVSLTQQCQANPTSCNSGQVTQLHNWLRDNKCPGIYSSGGSAVGTDAPSACVDLSNQIMSAAQAGDMGTMESLTAQYTTQCGQ